MTPLTVRDKVVEVLQAAGATEEMVAAAVGAAGEFGDSPPRPNIEIQVAALLEEAADRLDVSHAAATTLGCPTMMSLRLVHGLCPSGKCGPNDGMIDPKRGLLGLRCRVGSSDGRIGRR